MNSKITKTVFILGMSFLILCGCGKDEQLEEYKTQMSDFFDQIAGLNSDMNAIDASAEDAVSRLLSYLDATEAAFEHLADLEVPEEFGSVESLADEAAENMTQAVSFYHQLYEAESYDNNIAMMADEYYRRANIRLQYIISILHGEMPEGDNVMIIMEGESQADTTPRTEEIMETHGEIETENPLAED
ncbi:MAG: hypothetical protein K2K54_07675 [Lachnospiraceae bacterium]|nr:hypothetical protein [Lachnospiraceae bacterium]